LLVVANQKEHTMLVVDPDARRELARVVVGVNGHEVMVSKDGRFAYVPIYGNSGVGRPGTDGSTVDVVDLQERKLASTIDLGKPLRPHRAEWGPDGMLYVTAELGNAVDVLDPSTRRIVAEIPTGQKESHMLVISPDGRRAYTANVGAGSVSVLDLAKRRNAVIKVSGACTLSREPYPFPDIWDPLARVFDAWGFERCLWGTDWTRAFAVVNYEQAVEPFRQTDRLSNSERTMLMGGACAKAYGWSPKKA
jgi:YVTN family beta-propeller protein